MKFLKGGCHDLFKEKHQRTWFGGSNTAKHSYRWSVRLLFSGEGRKQQEGWFPSHRDAVVIAANRWPRRPREADPRGAALVAPREAGPNCGPFSESDSDV